MLVISQIFCTFIGENQTVTKDISDDYQGQSYVKSMEKPPKFGKIYGKTSEIRQINAIEIGN